MCFKMSMKKGIMKTILWTCFVLFCSTSVQGNGLRVEMESTAQIVRDGDSVNIKCWTAKPAHLCQIKPPRGDEVSISRSLPNGTVDNIYFDGNALEKGECNIRISYVEEKHNGIWKCTMTSGFSDSGFATRNIIVAKAPSSPKLQITRIGSPNYGSNTYKKGETVQFICSTSEGGRPTANMSIFIGDELISEDNRISFDNTKPLENTRANLTVSRQLRISDNGKMARCSVNHIALKQPLGSMGEKIQVWFEPQSIDEDPIQHFGFTIGDTEIINVTVDAFPQPEFTWYVNGEEIKPGYYGTERLRSLPAEPKGESQWLAQLKIDNVQKSDTEVDYLLTAKNKEGSQKYRVRISTSSEPERSGLGALHITGIVLAAMALLLLVLIAVFARATGRWCFAGGSTVRNIGESSDTESAGRYSRSEVDSASGRPRRPRLVLSQLFRRNKDKVSGTDTDTMRTVVTVDDEKIPDTTDVTEKSNPEGGLVYAELDLKQKEQVSTPRRVSEDKTEYAEILYTKPEGEETTGEKK